MRKVWEIIEYVGIDKKTFVEAQIEQREDTLIIMKRAGKAMGDEATRLLSFVIKDIEAEIDLLKNLKC